LKIFWGGGTAPSQTLPQWGSEHPLPTPHPPVDFGTSVIAPSAFQPSPPPAESSALQFSPPQLSDPRNANHRLLCGFNVAIKGLKFVEY